MTMQTVYVLTPLTDKAKEWLRNNGSYEPYQVLGEGIVVEHRFIADIVAGMMEDGMLIHKDFTVS